MLGLGLDHHPRAREPALGEPEQQPAREALRRERDLVDPRRGRIELHLLDEIRRRGDEHRRAGVETTCEVVKRRPWAPEARQHRVGRERGDVAQRREAEPDEQAHQLGIAEHATGHGAQKAAEPPGSTTNGASCAARRAASRAANPPSAIPILISSAGTSCRRTGWRPQLPRHAPGERIVAAEVARGPAS